MSLQSTAQELIVVDPSGSPRENGNTMSLVPLEVFEPKSEHSHDHGSIEAHDEPTIIEVQLEMMPGAGDDSPDPEPIEVHEEVEEDTSKAEDDNDAKKGKKNQKWDWESRGATGFVAWVKERCDDVPKHSGQDTAGLERAVAYLERLDNEISKAMRLDLDGELDANQIEKVRATIDHGIERLHDRLDKVKKNKKVSRKKKADVYYSEGLVKEGQKITGVQGVYITVPLLISRIARVCINGMVSAGHDIEDLYERQVKFYKLNDREQAEVMQLLADMGYAVRQDRGFMPNDDVDTRSSNNMDWAANYKG
jgi:hypothetical protein